LKSALNKGNSIYSSCSSNIAQPLTIHPFRMLNHLLSVALLFIHLQSGAYGYDPTWDSLDSRPLPAWYDGAKVGIFMHFGPYAVPGVGSEWFWSRWHNGDNEVCQFMKDNYRPNFSYQDFGPELKMEFFDANQFADLVKASGAKYFVFTTKHHDGFTNFPSPYTFGWNSVDVGPNRDVLGELRDAFKRHQDLHFGIYYSLFEWYNPMYLRDKANNFQTREYVKNKMLPEMKYLATHYKPDVWWSDGDWEANPEYFDSKEFLAWLYTYGPTNQTIVTNDRWGRGTAQKHGGFYSGPDRFNPGHKLDHKFENAFTIDLMSWGYRRNININSVMPIEKLVGIVAEIVSCNGNVLINVGPTKEGTICPIFQERLTQLGQWLAVNGEAIYDTKPFKYQNDSVSQTPQVWYTQKSDVVYAIALGWPDDDTLILGDVELTEQSTVELLGLSGQKLQFTKSGPNKTAIKFPSMSKFVQKCGKKCMPAYTLKLQSVSPRNHRAFDKIELELV